MNRFQANFSHVHERSDYNLSSNKVGTLWRTYIKTECNDPQILFDLYLIECSTKTRYLIDIRLQLLNSLGFLSLYFAPTIFNGRQVWLQAGQSSTCALLLRRVRHMQNVACHHLAGISKDIPEKDADWMAAYVAPKTCMYLSSFMEPSQMCKLPMIPWAQTHPHIITDAI